jgi:O-6-methylguanine DNA methyltransferase
MERTRTGQVYFEDGAEPSEEFITQLLRKAHSRFDPALARIRRPIARATLLDSDVGRLLAAQSARGLLTLRFADSDDWHEALAQIGRRFELVEDSSLAAEIAFEIEHLMHGEAAAVARRPVDLSLVESDFQRRALSRLRRVPAGSVVTYQGLAAAIGAPSSQRAIGNTVASNPLAIYVPCHRVIRSNGSIGNYGGGVERKLKLLRAEGFEVDRERRVPSGAVYGHSESQIFCRPDCTAVRRGDCGKWLILPGPERARALGMRACKLCCPA